MKRTMTTLRTDRDHLNGIWGHMHRRCYNPSARNFDKYGGRGIKVCERWHKFSNFYDDMQPRPICTTLDRIDNDKDYSPENCRWATSREQNVNRRYTQFIEHNGERMCMKDWARKIGMSYQTLHERIKRGWPVELALTVKPARSNSGLKVRTGNGLERPKKINPDWPTECRRGHALTPENTYHASSGKPCCKLCVRIAYRLKMGWPEHLAASIVRVPYGMEVDRVSGEIVQSKRGKFIAPGARDE